MQLGIEGPLGIADPNLNLSLAGGPSTGSSQKEKDRPAKHRIQDRYLSVGATMVQTTTAATIPAAEIHSAAEPPIP